jgi:uncharacterized repeat protein (TIGR03803 family)
MPYQQDDGGGGENRAASQRPPHPKTFWKSVFEKIVITARLMGKELYRLKLSRVDLPRADLRLGEKAYANDVSQGQTQLISRLDRLSKRVIHLRQSGDEPASTFVDKAKALAKATSKAAQILALQLERRRILRQLGKRLRESGASNSLAEETQSACAVADRISSLNADIRELARQTYPWARRPLLVACALFLLAGIGVGSVERQRHDGSVLQQRRAEAFGREAQRTQERIAGGKSAYKEQRDRGRAEEEKREREESQKRQRAAAERARLEEEQREQKRAVAEAKAGQEQQQRVAEAAHAKEQQETAAQEKQQKNETADQYAKLEQERARAMAQKSPAQPKPESSATQPSAPKTASLPEGLEQIEKLPHDPELLDKLYAGRFQEIGYDKMDLVAVSKGFQDANFRLKDNSGLNVGAEQFQQVSRYFSDLLVAVETMISWPAQPNYLKTLATIEKTGGVDGEWAQTTYKNFVRLVLQRASGEMPATADNEWRLMKRLIVKVSDSEMPKPKQQPDENERAAVDKQMQELTAKGALVILADYGDPSDKSTFNHVHLAFWYRDVPILRRELLTVSKAHPLAELGNVAVTEVPGTLGEARRKLAESLAAQEKRVEVTPDIDNPRYVAWKGFAPAATATYARNSWKQQGERKQPAGDGATEVRTLQSIDGANAVIKIDDKLQTFAAKIPDTRNPEERKPPVEEVVELNGKKFKCSRKSHEWKSWDRKVMTTTWTSDEVPGGLVRSLDDEEDTNGIHLLSDRTLQFYFGGKNGDWSGKPSGNPLFATVCTFGSETGINPKGGLIQGDDGNLYGTTSSGPPPRSSAEAGGSGTVFKLAPDGVLTTLHIFHGEDGASPVAGLTKGRDGNFYGTTSGGGARPKGKQDTTGHGTIFRLTPAGQLTTLHSFAGVPDGDGPAAELFQARDGNFYGTTKEGGEKCDSSYGGCGTIFKVTQPGELTILHRFNQANGEGRFPEAALLQGKDGNFYGTTSQGGKATRRSFGGGTISATFKGRGTIFRITPAGEFTTLHGFPEKEGDGEAPGRGLVRGGDDDFYGTTKGGGKWPGLGTIFKITSGGVLTVLYEFDNNKGDPSGPIGPLLRGSDGHFYGTTFTTRSIFRFSPAGSLTTLYRFRREDLGQFTPPGRIKERAEWAAREKAAGRDHPEVTDGSVLQTRLLEATDGTLWGTTEKGGIWDCGTVFKIDPTVLGELEKRK